MLISACMRIFTSAAGGLAPSKQVDTLSVPLDEAGLKECSVHGLRRAAAARLAELGCTEQEIMAITGHRTSKEVTRYTRAASQRPAPRAPFAACQENKAKTKASHLFPTCPPMGQKRDLTI